MVLLGSVAFIVPAVVTSRLMPKAEGALPSIMCHFAVLLAIGLVRLVHFERESVERARRGAPAAAVR